MKIRDRMNTGLKQGWCWSAAGRTWTVKIRDRMNTGLKHRSLLAVIRFDIPRENQRPDEYGIETVTGLSLHVLLNW